MSTIHFTGVPTAPDVRRLRDKFGVPDEGKLITYESLEETLGYKRDSVRFRTVVYAWRRALESEHSALMEAVPSKGLVRMTPDERVEHSDGKKKSGLRAIGRAVRIVAFTDRARLTPENQHLADHLTKCGAAIKLAIATASKPEKLPELAKK